MIPTELQTAILDHLLQSDASDKDLLQLSLVCKWWRSYIKNNDLWNLRTEHDGTSQANTDDLLPPKLLHFWFKRKRKRVFIRALDITKQAQYEKYTPWHNHDLIYCPKIFLKFIWAWVTVPEWMYFLIVAQVKDSSWFTGFQ